MKRLAHHVESTRRRGVVAVLVGITLITLLLFASLAIDVGYICALTGEMQTNADAGALAGASALTNGVPEYAKHRALAMIEKNQGPQGYQSLDDQIVELGQWDCMANDFAVVDPNNPGSANAVRVVAARNGVSYFFAGLFGRDSTDVNREAIAMGNRPCSGIWGINTLTVPGNVLVDSYDSTTGTYDPDANNENGDICSNGDISVAGSIEIYGDVMPGADATLTVDGAAAIITGSTCPHTGTVEIPPVDFTDVVYENDNDTIGATDNGNDPFVSGTDIFIPNGDNLTLAPGTYYFGSVDFQSNATLTLTGLTTIYMTGDFDIGAQGTVNTTQNPADLTIFSSGESIVMTGGATFYGSIYAPNTTITLGGNAEYFGAIVGKTVIASGSFQFHVDESLALSTPFDAPPPMLVR